MDSVILEWKPSIKSINRFISKKAESKGFGDIRIESFKAINQIKRPTHFRKAESKGFGDIRMESINQTNRPINF